VKAPGFNPWTYQAISWFQGFAFTFNSYRYNEAAAAVSSETDVDSFDNDAHPFLLSVGLYKLNSVDPKLENAWFQQPLRLSS
jgi:hypothetical protein